MAGRFSRKYGFIKRMDFKVGKRFPYFINARALLMKLVLFPNSREKGAKDSRVQGFDI